MTAATAVAIPPPMPFPQLDAAVTRVKEASAQFARLSLDERCSLLRAMRDGYLAIAEESVRLACAYKGHDFESPNAAEEWLGGPWATIRILRLTEEALEETKRFGAPVIEPSRIRTLPDGRLAVRVFPKSGIDAQVFPKHVGEAIMQPGITRENLKEHQAAFYKKPHGGRVCLVLGAGNVNSIPPTDVVYKMFAEGTACVLKMNPVNAYLGPLLERAFSALVAKGYFAVVYGGAEEGAYLVNHPGVDEVHITGSDKTHDAMVWGPPGPEREARKARNQPLLEKDVTSELGNISPVIVVPGPWDDGALDFQARNLAGMVCNNASFNCVAAKLLVTSRGWPQRGAFLERLAAWLEKAGPRKAWYPGAVERWNAFTEGRKGLRLIGTPAAGQLPFALITDVDRADASDRVWSQEPWCAVLSETAFDTTDVTRYCEEVTALLEEKVWGTLSATILVHSSTMRDAVGAAAVEKLVSALSYGSVTINTWPGVVFGTGTMTWGGFHGATLQEVQSGRGVVHNTYMLEGVEKMVMRAPTTFMPILPYFAGHRTADTLAKKLMALEYAPSWLKVPGIAATAFRG